MRNYQFKVILSNGDILTPKGLYYQGKNLVTVGCTKSDHTVRRTLKPLEINDIIITEEKN